MCVSETNVSLLWSLGDSSRQWFYKHLVPLGPKNTAVENRLLLLREQTQDTSFAFN
jgi:hypothetical protein